MELCYREPLDRMNQHASVASIEGIIMRAYLETVMNHIDSSLCLFLHTEPK